MIMISKKYKIKITEEERKKKMKRKDKSEIFKIIAGFMGFLILLHEP